MADNVAITAGSGTTIAADDIGGVLYQRVKIAQGADGVGVDVSSAAPLQVSLANHSANATAVKVDGSAVTQPVSGTVTITPSGTQTVSGTVAVSTINSVAPAFGTGVRGATVQRVTIATDDTVSITANSSVNVAQMNGVATSMGAGANGTGVQRVTLATDQTAISTAGVFSVKVDQTTDGTTNKVAATQATASNLNAQVVGAVASDAVDSGNPIKIGGKAVNAEITAVANADRVDAVFDLVGKQIVLPYANPENFVSGAITTAMTATTSTSLVAAPGVGLRNYITTIIVSNAHATVGTDVAIQDGSGGTTLLTIPAAAVYGGAVINLPVPLRQPTTNTALFCANVTTGASTKVSAVGYKGV